MCPPRKNPSGRVFLLVLFQYESFGTHSSSQGLEEVFLRKREQALPRGSVFERTPDLRGGCFWNTNKTRQTAPGAPLKGPHVCLSPKAVIRVPPLRVFQLYFFSSNPVMAFSSLLDVFFRASPPVNYDFSSKTFPHVKLYVLFFSGRPIDNSMSFSQWCFRG